MMPHNPFKKNGEGGSMNGPDRATAGSNIEKLTHFKNVGQGDSYLKIVCRDMYMLENL